MYSVRQYFLPLLFALLLHVAAVGALQIGWEPERQVVREIKPQIVSAELVVLEPKAKPKAAPKSPPKPASEATPKPQPKPEPAQAKPKPDPAIERARQERARREAQERERAQAEKDRRLAELESSAMLQAMREEAEALERAENAEAQADADAAVASFKAGIYQQVVGNWSRPPSARNRMEATLVVELVPTGDVVAVTLIKSSGNTAFDQSAEAAVRKARRFAVPKESALFEAHFRKFSLLFRPEDLLR